MIDSVVEFVRSISWSSAAGVLFGASISALVAFILQRSSFAEARRQKDHDRREVRKALGLALVFKMIRLASELHNLGKAVKECLDQAKNQGFAGSPFQVVMPIVPLPEPIRFLPEEMALILSIDNDLFNEMAALDELHNSTVGIFEIYNTKREAVMDRLGADMDGNMGTTVMNAEQKRWFDPRAYVLNQLVKVMIERTDQDGQQAWVAFEHLKSVIEKQFDMKLNFVRRSDPDAQPAAA
ncbi:hypothetical protein V1281_002647 [Nitrobacteraceae bacterium AZCC 2161]